MQNKVLATLVSLTHLLGLTSCDRGDRETSDKPPSEPWFIDVTEPSGVDFQNVCGSPGKEYILDSLGAGAALFDYDSDGDLDLYFVQGSTREHSLGGDNPVTNRLYRNDGEMHFEDVTSAAGVGDRGWGHGCAVGDVDGDSHLDLFVANWGHNALFKNTGDGAFEDISDRSLPQESGWSTSSAFGDYDLDGDLDLYVANYLEFDWRRPPPRGGGWKGVPNYSGPMGLIAESDALYRNDGAGLFTDVSEETGIAAAPPAFALAVLWLDADRDGDPDLYVANDTTPNYLFRNDVGAFAEIAVGAGLAYNSDGAAQAGMGIACADADGDGLDDLFVTNFAYDHNTLYRNLADGLWDPGAARGAIKTASLLLMGWGTVFEDLDSDQDPDLVVVNGHLYPAVDESPSLREITPYRQPCQLFMNDGDGGFADEGERAGEDFRGPRAGRGLAAGDLDGDGDVDLVVTQIDDRIALLRNETPQGHWLRVELRQPSGNRFAVGARVFVSAGGVTVGREVRAGSSYLCHSDLALHFGLGTNEAASVEIVWPGGEREVHAIVAVDRSVRFDREMK